jgi:hypothetical protein
LKASADWALTAASSQAIGGASSASPAVEAIITASTNAAAFGICISVTPSTAAIALQRSIGYKLAPIPARFD